MNFTREELVKKYVKMLNAKKATIFVGAGLSKASGHVDWKELMKEPTKNLGLNIEREADFPELAEMYVHNRGNRSGFIQEIFDQLNKDAKDIENHHIIASLPISTLWTTNFDTLIEDTFRLKGKKCYVIKNDTDYSITDYYAEITIVKLHGDIHSHPNDIVITRDDYEMYDKNHPAMASAFQTALIENSFLFLGFSFTDPNLQRFLSQIRANFGKNSREHYTILRQPEGDSYENKKFWLSVDDLSRYNIQTVVIREFEEVTEILKDIEKAYYRKNIFVSGSFQWGSERFSEQRLLEFTSLLGEKIISSRYNLTSGMGWSIGLSIVGGAITELYKGNRQNEFSQRLNLAPLRLGGRKKEFIHRYRTDLIRPCGFCIFIAGNRADKRDTGVLEEYRIAKEQGKILVPIGATGWAAKEIWKKENAEGYFASFGDEIERRFNFLNDADKSNEELIEAIFYIIKYLS